MSEALTVLNNNQGGEEMTFGADAYRGFEIKPTRMQIAHKTTQTMKEGHFFDATAGVNFKEIVVVLAAIPRLNRVLFGKDNSGKAVAICKSRDGLAPITDSDYLTPVAPKCGYFNNQGKFVATCEQASWDKYWKNGKRKEDKPPCREQEEFVFIDKETLLPYKMQVYKSSLKVFRERMSGVARHMRAFLAKGQNPQPYWFSMKLTLDAGNYMGSTYYTLNISDIQPLAEAERDTFKVEFTKVMNARTAVQDDREDDAIDGEIVDGPAQA